MAEETDIDETDGEDQTLIPRDILFGNPDKITTRLSPDGLNISFLAPLNGVLNLWVGPVEDPDTARPVTNDTHRGIRTYTWTYVEDHILYLQDRDGDENWRIYDVNLSSGEIRDFTPFEGVQASIKASSWKHPGEMIIALNKRDPKYHDLFKIDIQTGNMTLLQENPDFAGFYVDDEFDVRFASRMTAGGGVDIFQPTDDGSWDTFLQIENEDSLNTDIVGFNRTNEAIYLADSRGRDTSALYQMNLATGEKILISENSSVDFGGYMIHPTEKNVQAVAFYYDRIHWTIVDPSIAGDLDYLASLDEGDLYVVSRTLDDSAWIVVYVVDDGPARYYYYDHNHKTARFLFTDRKSLEGQPLARMIPTVIKSRDGLDMVCYYTLPLGCDADGDGIPDRPLPMLLNVHGGPWARDTWGQNSEHQWLANRGYAVLSVNFRGSTGFGKDFVNAGNMEWGRKMHDDLIDAVNWSISRGIADPDKVAIMGGSYGGYATLAGLTFTPDVFACGVDMVGPSNLITLIQSIPPYWEPEIEQLVTRVGDHRTEEGRALLEVRSPLNYVDRIRRPLLIGQGANDPRVKQNESDQIVEAMLARNLSVVYAVYPDEGHGFARPENRMSFYAIAEAFLAQHLGGRYEPIGDDFQGSSITVPTGAEQLPGLREALEPRM